MNDEINCPAFSDEFMDGSKEVNQVSSSDFENYSQNDEVLLEATVEVLQPIFKLLIYQKNQFFILLEHDPEKELNMKSYIETNLQPCLESSDSDLQAKKTLFKRNWRRNFNMKREKQEVCK